MRVRPDPLILGKEFAEEGVGTESHADVEPGGAGARGHAGTGTREVKIPCKGANAAVPRAKVQMLWKGVGVGLGFGVGKSEAKDSGGGKVGLTILGRPSGRAGMLDPTHVRSIHSGFRFPFE